MKIKLTKEQIDSIACESYDDVVVGKDHDLFVYQQGGKDTLVKYEMIAFLICSLASLIFTE